MHSYALAALLASAAVAKPINNHQKVHEKRDLIVETKYAVVVETVYVTNTAAPAAATAAAQLVGQNGPQWSAPWGRPSRSWSWSSHSWSHPSPTWTWAHSSSGAAPAPTSIATSSVDAPAPTSTEAPTPPPSTTTSDDSTTSTTTSDDPTTTSTTTSDDPTTSTSEVPPPPPTTTDAPPPPPTTTQEPSSTSTSVDGSMPTGSPSTYQDVVVLHHNIHRANHSAPEIAWDQGLADTAATIASSCNYAHNTDVNGGGYGQNIAAGAKGTQISNIITDLFYNGEVNWFVDANGQPMYNATGTTPDMTNFEHWGHFSQVVWKATTKVGCATQDCTAQGLTGVGSNVGPYFTVCNYEAPGNMGGEYGPNIGAPLGWPTVTGDMDVSEPYY